MLTKKSIDSVIASFDLKTKGIQKEDPQLTTRMNSYLIYTWIGKPLSLSPLICASKGWVNNGVDSLFCSDCSLSIQINIQDPTAECKNEVELLSSGHRDHCLWRHLSIGAHIVAPLTRKVILERAKLWSIHENIPVCYLDGLDQLVALFPTIHRDILALSLLNWIPFKEGGSCSECCRKLLWKHVLPDGTFDVVLNHR